MASVRLNPIEGSPNFWRVLVVQRVDVVPDVLDPSSPIGARELLDLVIVLVMA